MENNKPIPFEGRRNNPNDYSAKKSGNMAGAQRVGCLCFDYLESTHSVQENIRAIIFYFQN